MERSIGVRLKSLRTEQRMTLAELGEKVNLSTSYLSQIERDRTIPSLNTLMNIARVLNVEPRYFFDSGEDDVLVLRADLAPQSEAIHPTMLHIPLSPKAAHNSLQVYRVEIQPHSPPQKFAPYSGEQLCFVLSGELIVVVGDETYLLKAGDSIHYDSLLLHSWANDGDQPCIIIWGQANYG
jgi:transcriptional regulator with XRE-family HTH domain